MPWKQRLKTWIVPQVRAVGAQQPLVEAGMYHYQRPRDDGYMRFHLRVERSGESLLIAGASEAVRMSRDGTTVIKRLLDGETPEALAGELPPGAQQLVAEVTEIIEELGSPSSRFPIFNLSDPVNDPRDADLMAPFQADVDVEDLAQLRPIVQKLWEAGIPHARFLPAPQLSDDDLVQAVEWAEDSGMIAGVRATASWLMESNRMARLAAVGMDYVLSPWAVNADLHARWFGADDLKDLGDVIERAKELEVTPVVEIPLVAASVEALDDQWSRFTAWQVTHAEVYALARLNFTEIDETDRAQQAANSDAPLEASQLRQLAAWVEEVADENAFHVTWLPPVGVRQQENVADQARRGPRAGGDVTIRVLASGDVLPPRGAWQPAGNLLTNSWAEIWGSPVFRRFRQRVEANTRCEQCPGLAICAADCPADPGGWSHE